MNAPLIVILGPTASGKSSLAIHLARDFNGEIVNCDSVQVYKYLNIGTSKLTKGEQAGIPHHLMDMLEPDQLFTAGDYFRLGRKVLVEIRRRGHLPLVVGGTGLYLRALLDGLFEGPKRCERLRKRLSNMAERKGNLHLHRLLKRVDAISAQMIASNDHRKIVRALEVFFLTSKPLSWHFRSGRDPLRGFEILKIGLNPARQFLYELIDRRGDKMFADGLVDEVKRLLSRGFSPDLKPLQSLGYFRVVQFLRGQINLAEALALTKRDTRHYAKRQLTWFRRENGVAWFDSVGNDPLLQSHVGSKVTHFLKQAHIEVLEAPYRENLI